MTKPQVVGKGGKVLERNERAFKTGQAKALIYNTGITAIAKCKNQI